MQIYILAIIRTQHNHYPYITPILLNYYSPGGNLIKNEYFCKHNSDAMKQRIKALYIFTILSIVAFGTLEGWWLVQKYNSVINDTSAGISGQIISVADETMRTDDSRNPAGNDTDIRMSTSIQGDSVRYSGAVVIHRRFADLNPTVYADVIADMIKTGRQDEDVVETVVFNGIEVENADINTFAEALARVRRNEANPFSPAAMKSVVDKTLHCDCSVDTIRMPTGKIWKPVMELSSHFPHPTLKVIYPYNPLQGGAAVISLKVPVQAALNEMIWTFALSLLVATLLITCLLCQLSVIRHQHRIADLQKGYTLTMLHELKRPLASLKLMLSFLRNPRLTDDDKSKAMNNASREIDNLSAYFNKLRAITYNESAEMPLTPTSFSLAGAINDSIAQQATPDRIKKTATGDITLTAERQEIVNAVCNLLENALKYSAGEIAIDWSHNASTVAIRVSDNGAGIEDGDKKLIFDRFYRSERHKAAPGMGLGLAYVKQVAEAHGGSIEVADNPGGGSIFTLKIPQLSE